MTRGLGLEAVLTKALPPSSRFIAWSTNFECGFVAIASAMNCARRVCTGSPRLSPHALVMIAWHACLLPFVLRGTNQLLHEMFAQAASRYDNPINREVWACVWCVSSMRMLISFSDGIAARRFRDRGAIAFGMYAALPVDIAENEVEQSRVLTWAKFTAKTLAKQMICALIMRQESLRLYGLPSHLAIRRIVFHSTRRAIHCRFQHVVRFDLRQITSRCAGFTSNSAQCSMPCPHALPCATPRQFYPPLITRLSRAVVFETAGAVAGIKSCTICLETSSQPYQARASCPSLCERCLHSC